MLLNQFFQIENAKIASLLIHCQRSNYSLRTVDSVNMFINKQTNNSQVVNVFTDRNVLELNRGQIILLLQTRLLKTVFMNTICRQFCIAILLLQEHYCKKHYCKNTTAHIITTKNIISNNSSEYHTMHTAVAKLHLLIKTTALVLQLWEWNPLQGF